jgi:hypothetical protein
MTAAFLGDGAFQGSSGSKFFTIKLETATATYTGDTIAMTTSTNINLQATVQEESDSYPGTISKAAVIFTVCTSEMPPVSCTTVGPASVSSLGVATGQYPTGGKENTYLVTITFDAANKYYTGVASEPTVVDVYAPTGAFATGGGWITDTKSGGGHGNFGFTVRSTLSKVQGHSVYVYRVMGADGKMYDWVIKSTAWTGLTITCTTPSGPCRTIFQGKAVVQQINSVTGEVVWSDGNFQFTVTVWDNTKTTNNGGVDTYQIVVLDKNGKPFWSAGGTPPGTLGNLKGGQIVVHKA